MLRRGYHENDVFAGLECSVAVHDEARLQRPARVCLGLDAGQLALGHAGIMLERHVLDGAVLVAHRAGEGNDGADVAAPHLELRDLGADVEILLLDADHISLRSPAGRKRSRARARSPPRDAHGSRRWRPGSPPAPRMDWRNS